MSATSGVSSATSGTLGDAPPVSFPGVSSGIDYNSIIEKYTAETLAQEKPTVAQVNNLTSQNTAVLKIKTLIGSVQDSLTALSNPTVFGAFKASVANTSSGSPAATATQISGQTPIAGTYTINAQTVATATTIANNSATANAAVNASVALVDAGTAITPTNGTASSGSFTINGTQIKYNVDTDSLNTIVNRIQAVLTATTGGTATLLANGELQLTGVTTLGSGADSGNLEQVLKLDTAPLETLNLNGTLGSQTFQTPLNFAGTPGIQITTGSGPTTVNYTAGETLQQLVTAINAVPGATATATSTGITITGVTAIADTGGGNLIEALGLTTPDTATSTQLTGLNPAALLNADPQIVPAVTAGTLTVNTTSGPSSFTYDPTTDSLNTVIAKLNAIAGVTASFTNGELTITGVTSLVDSGGGNLTTALGLSTPTNTSTAQLSSVTSSTAIAGINQDSALASTGSAGFATTVTAGTFTINGVSFTVDPTTQSLSDVITQINQSTAGVTATYNQQTSQILLTSKVAGPQSILLGASGDTSNFLTATGLKNGSTTAGTQASLTYTNATGSHTVYSSTNDFTSVIPGIDLNINTSSPATLPAGSTYYTVTVATDPSQAETAINKFVTAYNAVIQELNKDTAAPTVTPGSDATTGTATATSSGGGVLYGNYDISGLRDQLVQLVSGFIPSGSTSYNSLQSIGLQLDTNSQSVGTSSDSSDSTTDSTGNTTNSDNNSITVNATSGQLQTLDTTTFEAAYAADPTAIQSLFTSIPTLTAGSSQQPAAGATYGFAYLLGTSLANFDGLSTFLQNSVITPDNLSSVLLTTVIDSNNQQIDSLEQQINLVNQEATQQADQLRAQFSASETQIAELQALQGQIAAIGH